MSTTPVAPAGRVDLDDRVGVIEAAFDRHWRHFGGYCRLPVFATAALFGTHHH